jgi:hypothetical protein
MAIVQETEVARAEVTQHGVRVWQHHRTVDYTPETARELAAEILEAASEAEQAAVEGAMEFPSYSFDEASRPENWRASE